MLPPDSVLHKDREVLLRKSLAIVFALTAFAATAAPAVAGPGIPKNCQEFNDLLGIDNVRSCENDS